MTRGVGGRTGGGRGRLPALALLAAAVAGGGLLGTRTARAVPDTSLQPAALAAEVASLRSVSSSWYCPAAPSGGGETTRLLLANAAATPAAVRLVVADARGAHTRELRIGPHGDEVVAPGRPGGGTWFATRVDVAGGGVSATELVDGRAGRAVAPCASEVSPRWYFATGSTRGGSALHVTLTNPTPNLAVVDLSFVTSSGFTTPAPFQGLVVAPWAVRVLTVGAYVQNQASVATVVATRSGSVVAGEFQLYGPGGAAGLSLSLGVPTTSTSWDLPGVQNASGGASELAVFNPSAHTERVAVEVRLPAGPVAPFTQVLGPASVWILPTSQELRIATGQPYSLRVRASGQGVVVARVGSGAPDGPAPWWAQNVAVPGIETTASRTWLVTGLPSVPPGTDPATRPPRPAVTAATVQVENPGRHAVRVKVTSWSSGRRHVRAVRVKGFDVATLPAPRGLTVVRADGAVAVVGDASPVSTVGVVGIPAEPLRQTTAP
jgi:hypothetical protein